MLATTLAAATGESTNGASCRWASGSQAAMVKEKKTRYQWEYAAHISMWLSRFEPNHTAP